MRPMPSPVTTATTVGHAGPAPAAQPDRSAAPSRTQRSSSTCSARSVTRMSRGRPASSAGLDGRPDVVGVDVAVPQALPPDDDDRVADARPHLLKVGDGVGRGLEQVHDLEAQVAHVRRTRRVGQGRRRPGGGACRATLGQGPAVEHVEQGVEEQEVAGAAGVDHAGPGQHVEHARASGPARRPRPSGPTRPRPTSRWPCSTAWLRPRRRRPGPRSGWCPRPGAPRPGGPGRRPRPGPRPPRPARPAERGQPSARPRSSWDRMTPELPRAPIERPVGHRLAHLGHLGLAVEVVELGHHGLERAGPCWSRCRRRAPGRR